jgi:hypothetical protein
MKHGVTISSSYHSLSKWGLSRSNQPNSCIFWEKYSTNSKLSLNYKTGTSGIKYSLLSYSSVPKGSIFKSESYSCL